MMTLKSNKSFIIKILIPTILVAIGYTLLIITFIIPTIESSILEKKKDLIKQIINSTWPVIEKYHGQELAGGISQIEAQEKVLNIFKNIRYGKNDMGYFWVNDNEYVMVMHPYRDDLIGTNVENFQDENGTKLFKLFVDTTKESGRGYVEYMWQRKGKEERALQKMSYVRGFSPWGWVIGTGVYVQDVKEEITAITGKLFRVSLVIILGILFVLIYTMRQSYKIEVHKREYQEQNEELVKLNATKNIFFSILAHDLKNPIAIVLGFCKIIKMEFQSESPKLDTIQDITTQIDSSVKRINRFLENLLTWSRLQTNNHERQVESFSLVSVVNECFELLGDMAREKEINLKSKIEENLMIESDKNMISTVIRNLVSNALKFTNKDGEILVEAASCDCKIQINIVDNGIGMQEHMIENLFKIDKVMSTCGTSGEQGSGIGLILCDEFIKKNNGKIWVTSQVGQGTTFHIELPKL